MRFGKTDQRRFKLWKFIKELNLEHLKSPCSVYLTRLFFDLIEKKNKIFWEQLPVRNIWSNRPRLLFEEIRYVLQDCFVLNRVRVSNPQRLTYTQIFVLVVPRLKDRFTYPLYTSTSETFHIPEAWTRYSFRAEPCLIGHYREYTRVHQQSLPQMTIRYRVISRKVVGEKSAMHTTILNGN